MSEKVKFLAENYQQDAIPLDLIYRTLILTAQSFRITYETDKETLAIIVPADFESRIETQIQAWIRRHRTRAS